MNELQECQTCGQQIGRSKLTGECYVHTATHMSACPGQPGRFAKGTGYHATERKIKRGRKTT